MLSFHFVDNAIRESLLTWAVGNPDHMAAIRIVLDQFLEGRDHEGGQTTSGTWLRGHAGIEFWLVPSEDMIEERDLPLALVLKVEGDGATLQNTLEPAQNGGWAEAIERERQRIDRVLGI